MKALVTGASSGIGREIAKNLSQRGYDIIAVARDGQALKELKEQIPTQLEIFEVDLSEEGACEELYKKVKRKKVEV